MKPSLLIAGALLCWGAPHRPAAAQIVTDRPDFVESSSALAAGTFQIETSVGYERAGRSASFTTPTLLRYGVGGSLELRLESDLWVRDASERGAGSPGGIADAAVGLKWHVADAAGSRPATALLLHAELPSGSPLLRGEGVRPSARAAMEWTLPAGLGLGFMPGVGLERGAAGSRAVGILGLVVGREVAHDVRLFGEIAFESFELGGAGEGGGAAVGTWNTGVSVLLSDRMQLDAAASLPATRAAPGLRLTAGLSRLVG